MTRADELLDEAAPPTTEGGRRRLASRWGSFLLKRGIGLAITIVVLITLTFLLVRLIPGDPAVAIAELEQVVGFALR